MKFDSAFFHRLKVYLFGVALGCIAVYFILIKDRDRDLDYWLPEKRITAELSKKELLIMAEAKCLMICNSIYSADIKLLLQQGDVKLGKSKGYQKPHPWYYIVSKTATGKDFGAIVTDMDKVARVDSVFLVKPTSRCDC